MVALLFALLLIGLTLAVLEVAGPVVAVLTGIVALNLFVVIVGVARRRRSPSLPDPPPDVVKTHPITGRQTKTAPTPSDVSHIQ
jgi:hypothetical protein